MRGYVVELWQRLQPADGVAPTIVDSPLAFLTRTCAFAQLMVPDPASQKFPLAAE